MAGRGKSKHGGSENNEADSTRARRDSTHIEKGTNLEKRGGKRCGL